MECRRWRHSSLKEPLQQVSGVRISGATLQLMLGCCLEADADVSLVYTPQAVDELEDPTGNDVAAFVHPIDNRTVPGPALDVGCGPGTRAAADIRRSELDCGASTVPADSFVGDSGSV